MERKAFLYSVKDTLAQDFGPLFEAVSHPVALRATKQMLRTVDESSRNDYVLFCVGDYNIVDGSMVFTAYKPEEFIEVKAEEIK